jgi:large subunit ribosomal protein L9
MEVILKQDVDHLGLRGEVVNVARGYARNFLLPRGLAEVASPAIVKELEKRDAQRARHEAKSVDEARAIATRLEKLELRFNVNAGPTGALFGSVTATNVADRLWEEEKIRVDRRKLDMETIKRIGRYRVPLEVFTDVVAELKLVVAPEGQELPAEEELAELAAREQAEAEAAAAAAAAEHEAAEAAAEAVIEAEEADAEEAEALEPAVEEPPAAPAEPEAAEPETAEPEPAAVETPVAGDASAADEPA